MLRKISFVAKQKQIKPSANLESKPTSQRQNSFLWLTIGVFLFALVLYGVLVFGNTGSNISYSPSDVVYGDEFRAIHDMNVVVNTKSPSLSSKGVSEPPKIQVSEYFYDFGGVNSNEILSRTFVIANVGKIKLVIERAYTTCGCTIADFSAKEIPPGKVALMTVYFDTGFHDMRGTTVRRGVMVETNDPHHSVQEIWIQASVR